MCAERRLAAFLIALAACGGSSPDLQPRLSSMEPPLGYVGRAAQVVIHGERFFVKASQTGGSPGYAVNAGFRASLDGVPLEDVRWLDERTLAAHVPGTLAIGVHSLVVESPHGTRGDLPGAFEVVSGQAPRLAGTLSVSAAVSSVGQTLDVALDLTNDGDAEVRNAAPALRVTGVGASVVAAPASADVPPHGAARFSWRVAPATAGTASLEAIAVGTDGRTGERVESKVAVAVLQVVPPGALAARVAVSRAVASVGQDLLVEVTLANAGAAAVRMALPQVSPVGGGLVTEVARPAALDVPAGGEVLFTFVYQAAAAGEVVFDVDASGTEENTGELVWAARARSAPLAVQTVPALAARAASTAVASVGQVFTATLLVTNTGQAAAIVTASMDDPAPGVQVLSSPAPAVVGGLSSDVAFTWTCRAAAAGAAPVTMRVTGSDVNDPSRAVSAFASTAPIQIQTAALLTATATPVPQLVSVGQTFAVTVLVSNAGDAAADVVPAIGGSGPSLELLSAPGPLTVSAHASGLPVQWTFRGGSRGLATLIAEVIGHDVNDVAHPVSASASAGPVAVQNPPRLEASTLEAAPALVNQGQAVALSVTVTNSGEATAVGVRPAGLVASGVPVTITGPVPSGGVTLSSGASQVFTWRAVPSATGDLSFRVQADGQDANSSAALPSVLATSSAVHVQRPAQLALEVVAAPARVDAGQSFAVTVRATNLGDATARDVLVDLAVPGSTPGPAPAGAAIPGGASRDFDRTFTAGTAGAATATGSLASATDATDGRVLSAATVSRSIPIDAPAVLTAAVVLPVAVPVGDFTAKLVVTNIGDALATGVLPIAPPQVLAGTTVPVALKAVGANPAATLGRGEQAIFSWTYSAGAKGAVQLGGSASGTDANDGGARSATAPAATMQVGEAIQLASNPLGGGTFSFVFGHGDRLWLGPTPSGSGAVRCDPANCAATLETLAFSFYRDTIGNVSSNKAPPYSSLGHTGCTPDSSGANACGPDNEDGRGFFTSGVLGGQEWIVAGGARSGGDLDYVYLSPGGSGTVPFSFVDLSRWLGGNTRGFSAALVFNDRLYLGFPDNGGSRPYGVVLTTAPVAPGLDANAEAIDMQLDQTPLGKAPGSILMIDTFAAFAGRLYAFNNGGCIGSLTGTPAHFGDFAPCTPTAAAWTGKTSIAPARQYDLEPADRAVPQAAVWMGRLYMGRNTTTGPQLWACDPARSGDVVACDPADWSLVAPAASGDPQLTQLGDPGNVRITIVTASAGALYVGYDNASGARLYRTTAAAPAAASDFTGASGCAAGSAGCTGLGGAGLGDAAATRFFDARALDLGGVTRLYVTTGDGTAPVSVHLIPE